MTAHELGSTQIVNLQLNFKIWGFRLKHGVVDCVVTWMNMRWGIHFSLNLLGIHDHLSLTTNDECPGHLDT